MCSNGFKSEDNKHRELVDLLANTLGDRCDVVVRSAPRHVVCCRCLRQHMQLLEKRRSYTQMSLVRLILKHVCAQALALKDILQIPSATNTTDF